MAESESALPDDEIVHRIGGGSVENLRLNAKESLLVPPGISVLLGGSAKEAAAQMWRAFPDARRYQALHSAARVVGSATVGAIRAVGFDVVRDPTIRFSNHARLVARTGSPGFTESSLALLAQTFVNSEILK